MKMTTLQMTKEDAELFILFRKYQNQITVLIEHQVFKIKNGSATLHFNSNGVLDSVSVNLKIFKK